MNLLSKLKRNLLNFDKKVPSSNIFELKHVTEQKCGRLQITKFQPFIKPDSFSSEDVYTVLSYYIKWIEKRMNFSPCSKFAIDALDKMLDDLGFTHLDEEINPKIPIPLYTLVNCRHKIEDYFEWFTDKVSLKDVIKIYENAGLEFKDPEEVYATYLNHLEFTHKKTANEI